VWCDITTFNVFSNALTGSLPSSITASWTSIRNFQVAVNAFTGVLPELPFARMSNCLLFAQPSNAFECPLPPGAIGNCNWFGGSAGNYPVSSCDCEHKCTGYSRKLVQEECNAWGCFYDAAGGADWKVCSDSKDDPCSCLGTNTETIFPVCDPIKDNTTILNM
jgi:hypothetical protein